jgi:hypothetical protein
MGGELGWDGDGIRINEDIREDIVEAVLIGAGLVAEDCLEGEDGRDLDSRLGTVVDRGKVDEVCIVLDMEGID